MAARAHWLTVEWLPKYAPELNDIEPVWRDLKAHHLAHQTFTDVAALDQAIHDAVTAFNRERIPNPLAKPRESLLRSCPSQRAESPPAPARCTPCREGRVLLSQLARVCSDRRGRRPTVAALASSRHYERSSATFDWTFS